MLHPYQNYLDSYFFYNLAYSQSYFNYELYQKNARISTNLILVDNECKTDISLPAEDNNQETKSIPDTSLQA